MDRLTELQGHVDQLGTLMYQSIGHIQKAAPSSKLNIQGFDEDSHVDPRKLFFCIMDITSIFSYCNSIGCPTPY